MDKRARDVVLLGGPSRLVVSQRQLHLEAMRGHRGAVMLEVGVEVGS